ncbi:MAG TPA: hypothetical protein VJZ00_24410, partial [Thermoanaerobaculia bacterium]|nr:hypothetical protein [Thermoanaerobaculia bacterium]
MIGHRLTWGIPIETGGWQVVANSLPSLGAEELNALMSMTNVGTVDERGFTDGYGYFGEFHADGAAWAVFAHLYRSRKPVFTGRHFVQRDVCLAPVSEFRAMNNDAQPFFEVVPEPRVFGTVETATARWDAEPRAQPSEPRLARLESLPKEFLRDVLLAFLQPHPTIIVWQSPDASLLTSLLLLFPKVVRQRLTFCTAVGDVGAAQVRIKCIPAFKPDPTSAIVDFDRKLFRQPLVAVESMLPAQLVSAWQSGRLAELHAYLDDAVQWPGEQPFTRWL